MTSNSASKAKQVFGEALEMTPMERTVFLETACGSDVALRGEVEALLAAFHAADEFLVSRDTPATDARPFASPVSPARPPDSGDSRFDRVKAGDATISRSEGSRPQEGPGTVIGRYKLLQEIGHGGFGTVFMAEQREPVVRKVALKVIKLGMDTRQVIARFQAERQALAMMDHANIARVLDAGATETGRPYFVMELVRGERITDYCDEHQLSIRERLELFTQVCHAVQHAHTKGVIHRDIKPSNVLVTIADAKPVPKVIDFGIAKAMHTRLTDMTLFTEFRALIGTPAYMSPEQAEMSSVDIDTRSDVYSLGVLLYELLTGTTPFDDQVLRSAGQDELRRIIREVAPPRPSTRVGSDMRTAPSSRRWHGQAQRGHGTPLDAQHARASGLGMPPLARGSHPPSSAIAIARQRRTDPPSLARILRSDLDWIVMKCLEKDRTRRYETASGLAMEIQRFLSDEPVVARPPSIAYRASRLIRRNKTVFVSVASIFLVATAAAVASTLLYFRSESERDRAVVAEKEAEVVTQFLSGMLESANPAQSKGREVSVSDVLDQAVEKLAKSPLDQPLVEARLRLTIGVTYHSLGKYQAAETQLRQALAIRKQVLGERHPEVAAVMEELGSALERQSKYAEAESYHRGAFSIYQKVLGDEHPSTLESLNSVGFVLWNLGKHVEAEEIARRTVDGFRKLRGPEDHGTLLSMYRLAHALREQGKYSEAESLFREVFKLQKLETEDPFRLWIMNNLAHTLFLQRQIDEAEELNREAVEIQRRVLGDDHLDTLVGMLYRGLILKARGRLEEAERVFREAIERFSRNLTPDHPYALGLQMNLANTLMDQQRFDESEILFRKTIETARRVVGESHPLTLNLTNDLAELVGLKLGRLDEAEAILRQSLEVIRQYHPGGHQCMVRNLAQLAAISRMRGQWEEAEQFAREALTMTRDLLGPDHTEMVWRLENLSDVLRDAGRLDEAEQASREALLVTQRVFGERHKMVGWRLTHLSFILLRKGSLDEAVDLARQRLNLAQTLYAADGKELAWSEWTLADALKARGEYDEAEVHFHSAIDGLRHEFGPRHLEVARCEAAFVWMLRERGRLDEAELLARESLEITREVLGPDHIEVATRLQDLADVLLNDGRFDEAEAACREGLELVQRLLGATHRDVGWRLGRLSDVRQRRGQLDEAVDLARQRLELAQTPHVTDRKELALSEWNLADALRAKREFDEAEAFYRSAIEGLRSELGPRHLDVARCETAYAWLLRDCGRMDEAEHMLRDALAILHDTHSDHHREAVWQRLELARLLDNKGKLGEAEMLLAEAVPAARNTWNAPHVEIAQTLADHGKILNRLGRFEEAEPILRECLAMRCQTLGEQDWRIASSMSLLGEALAGLERFDEAEPLLLEGQSRLAANPQTPGNVNRDAIERLVKLYDSWNSAEPDQDYDAKAAEWRAKLPASE